MESQTSLDYLIEAEDFLGKFAKALERDDEGVRKHTFEILAALCVYSKEGYNRALGVLEHHKNTKKKKYRFSLVVDELRATDNVHYKIILLEFINCLIIYTDKAEDRIRIRNEFFSLKLQELLNSLKSEEEQHIVLQLQVFEDHKANDEEQFPGVKGLDLNSALDIFNAIFKQVSDSPLELYFLTCLQNLLKIDNKDDLADKIWQTTEQLISKCTLIESSEGAQKLLVTTSRRLDKQSDGKCCCSCHKDCGERGQIGPKVPSGNNKDTTVQAPAPPPPPPPPGAGPPPPPPPPGAGPPPPPPPPPPGGAPPPPPMGGFASPAASKALPQQITPKPKAKMRSLQWQKIPSGKVVGKDNLWTTIGKCFSSFKVDYSKMDDLFSVNPLPQATSTESSTPGTDKKKKENSEVTLIESRRSLNVNIFLKQFRMPHDEIIRLLREGNSGKFGVEKLRGLLKLLPTHDEVDIIKAYDGNKEKLGEAEKFFVCLMGLPNYTLRIEGLLIKEEFNDNMEWIRPSIESVIQAAKDIKDNQSLRELIYLVLIAGNYLNSGNYAGNAAGFKLSSLVKLTEIRANKPRMNLMHYVVMEAEEKNPKLLSFPDEMKALKDASQTSVDSLSSDILTLANKVSTITDHINRMNDNFRGQMEPFLKEANYEMLELKEDLKDIDSLKTDLAEFFCEEANAFKLEECFKTLSIFCERFKKAVEENKLRRIQEEKAKARRKQKENDHSKRTRDVKEPNDQSIDRSVNEDGSIVDMLLADVRSGFASRPLGENNFTVTKVKKVTLDSLNTNGSLQTGVGDATSKPETPEIDPNDFVRLGFGRMSMRRRRLQNTRQTDSPTMDSTDTESTCSSLEDANDTLTTKRTRKSYATSEDESLIDFLMQSGEEPDKTPFDKNGSMRRRRKERLERRGLLDVFSERERAPSPALSDQSCDKSQSISDSPLTVPERPKLDVVDKHSASPLRRTRSMVDRSAVDRALARAQDFAPKKSLEDSDHEQFLSRMKQKLHNKTNDNESNKNYSVISDKDSPVKVTVESPTDVRPRNRWRSNITNVIPESPLETISEKDKTDNSSTEDKNNNVKVNSALTRSREQYSSRFRNTLDSAELSKMMNDVDPEQSDVNVSINEKLNRAYNLQEDLKKVETGEKALGNENVGNCPCSRPETPVDITEENLKKKRERRKMRSQLSMEEVHKALKKDDKPELSNDVQTPKSPVVPPRHSRSSNSDLNKSENSSGPNSPTDEKHILSKAAKLAGKKKFRQDRFGAKDTSGSDSSVNRCKSNVEIDNVDQALRDYVSQGNMSRSKSYDESVAKQALGDNQVHLRGSGSTPDTCAEKQAIRRGSTSRLSSCDDRRYGRIFDGEESKSNSVGQLSQGSCSPKSQSRLSIRSTNTSTETITANQSDGDKSPETRRKNSANSQGNMRSPKGRNPTIEQFTPKHDWTSNMNSDDSDDPYSSIAKWKQNRRSLRVSHSDYPDLRSKSIFGRGDTSYTSNLRSDPNEMKNEIGSRSSYASSQDEGFESMSGASGSQRASMASTLDSNENNIPPMLSRGYISNPLPNEIIEEDKKQRTDSWTASTLHATVSHNNSLDSAVDLSPASPISSHGDQRDDVWTENLNDTIKSNISINEGPKTSTPKSPNNGSKTASKSTRSTPSYMRGTHSSVTKTPPTTESRFDRNKNVRASMRVEQTLRRSAAAQSSNLSKSKTQTGSNTSLTGSNSSDISSSTAHSKASTIRRRLTTSTTSRPTTPSSRPTTPSARPTTPSTRPTTPSTRLSTTPARTTTRTPTTPTKQTPSKPASTPTKASPLSANTPSKPLSRTQSMRVTSTTRKSIASPTTESSRSRTPSFMEPTASFRAARKELPQVPTPESTPKAKTTSSASGIKPAGNFTPSPLTRHGSMRRSTKSPAPAVPTIEELKADKGKLSPAKKVINKVSRQLPTVSETRGSFRRSDVAKSAK